MDKGAEPKFYVQAAKAVPVTKSQIVKRIEKRSTVSSADVKAVLDALEFEIIDALQNGNSVRLGDIGSFRVTIKSEGVATAAEATKAGSKLIKRVNVQFSKGSSMLSSFKVDQLKFTPLKD